MLIAARVLLNLKLRQHVSLDRHNYITNNVVMKSDYLLGIPEAWRGNARVFTALGDEHRQRIVLLFEPGERLSISQIVAVSPLSRTAVSHHLGVLRDAGVLQSEKVGKEVMVWLDKQYLLETFETIHTFIKKNI